MDIEPTYWKRIGYVSIENDAGGFDSYDGLDFKFRGTMVGDFYPTFDVGILGMTMDDIKKYTILNPYDSISRGRRIKVFAGYEKDGLANPLMEGFIYEAIPTNPPNMWINFKCLSTAALFGRVADTETIEASSCEELFYKFADKIGVSREWSVENEIKIEGHDGDDKPFKFDMSGVIAMLPDKFSKKFGVMVYYSHGRMIAKDRKGWEFSPRNSHDVSVDNGMLGLGNITFYGCDVRRRLDDTVDILDWINVKSKIVGIASKKYYVVKKTHVGHLRGNEWYTILNGIKEGQRKI